VRCLKKVGVGLALCDGEERSYRPERAHSSPEPLRRLQVNDLPYDTICNGHGPMLRYNMRELVGDYRDWSAKVGKAATTVAVLYSDNYGYCDRLSQQLARGIVKANVATEMVDLVRCFPLLPSDASTCIQVRLKSIFIP
jgi:hypothetical protein